MMNDVLLVKSGGPAALAEWQAAFAAVAPALAVRWWDDPAVDPTHVRFVLVWEPTPGRLKTFPNLQVIFSSAAGVDHIVRDPELPQHLPVVRMVSPESAQSMAEYVSFAALSMLRRLPRIRAAQTACTWDNFEGPETAPVTRVGIMGLGSLGQASARMLRAIGFPVSGWSRSPRVVEHVRCFAGTDALEAFLRQADIVIGLLPDTPETRGLLDRQRLSWLPQGASVVNAGRGSLVVLDDLIALLDSGHLRSAMLDVFEPEPLPSEHPAWRHPAIVITPHVAGFASRRARAEAVAHGIATHARGEALANLYLPERGY
jgi:glyoxylate/hydroxypyruvate reductase A